MMHLIIRLLCCACFCLVPGFLWAQNGLAKGAPLPNLSTGKVLNHYGTGNAFAQLQKKLTIVDFFGTWCVPCIRALPHLTEIQEAFKEEVAIILVSNEQEAQLSRFIAKRQPFVFPVVVDANNQWNEAFRPPALPYTVVIKDNKVLAITEASGITKEAVGKWLQAAAPTRENSTATESKPALMVTNNKSSNAAVRLSQDFIYRAKTGDARAPILSQLSALSYPELVNSLDMDNKKKAFWINLYNGYTQAALQEQPDLYKKRNTFFSRRSITVAGQTFSLDEIEHGILRRSKSKWSLGYWNKLFPSHREKQLRVMDVDYRIHFALNCGAKSCPPIAFYNDETLEAQLDLATKAYLNSEARYDREQNILYLPKLMSWFRADFGGKKGMKKILAANGILPAGADPRIRFNDYDWTLSLNQYTTQEQ